MTDPSFYVFSVFTILIIIMIFIINNDNKYIVILLCSVFILVASIRNINIPDTYNYYYYFKNYNTINEYTAGQEIFFVYFSKSIKFITNNYKIYFSIITLLNTFLIYRASKNLKINTSLFLLSYISFYGLSYNFIFLRIGIAHSIFIYGYSLLKYKKRKSILCFIIAPFFHTSILFTIFVFLFTHRLKQSRYFFLLILFLSLCVYLSGITDILAIKLLQKVNSIQWFKYGYYVDNIKYDTGYSMRYILNLSLLSYIIFKIKNFNKNKNIIFLAVLGIFVTALFSYFLWVDRVTDVLCSFIFIIITIFSTERNDNNKYRIDRFALFLLYIISNLIFQSRILLHFI